MTRKEFFDEIRTLVKQGNPEFALITLKSELQSDVWDREHIEKETSSLPQSELIRLGFDRDRIEALRIAEKKLHRITERERKALKTVL